MVRPQSCLLRTLLAVSVSGILIYVLMNISARYHTPVLQPARESQTSDEQVRNLLLSRLRKFETTPHKVEVNDDVSSPDQTFDEDETSDSVQTKPSTTRRGQNISSLKSNHTKRVITRAPVTSRRNKHVQLFPYKNTGTLNKDHSKRVKELKPFDVQVTDDERMMIYKLLATFDSVLKLHNITYMIYGGTLLGSFRHHDLIPWDDDIDVFVDVNSRTLLRKIFKSFRPSYILKEAGTHDKFYSSKGKKANRFSWLWPYVDISYYDMNDTFVKDIAKVYGQYYVYPKSVTFPLHNRPFYNLSLPAPKDTFAFLVWTYGLDATCHMFGYSHMVEGGGPHGKTDCSDFLEKYPFVHHYPSLHGVREVLRYRNQTLTDTVIPEPSYAVAKTFEIGLKDGFKIPKDVPLP